MLRGRLSAIFSLENDIVRLCCLSGYRAKYMFNAIAIFENVDSRLSACDDFRSSPCSSLLSCLLFPVALLPAYGTSIDKVLL